LIHVVLFEPEIPPNTGNVMRLCANTGAKLHLVRPLGFRLDDRSLRRSGLDYRDLVEVTVHRDLGECLTALAGGRILAVETGAPSTYCELTYRGGDAFVFGPETRGLPATVLDRIAPGHRLSIPMRPGSRSLNLSNAVAVVVFEAWRQLRFAGSAPAGQGVSFTPSAEKSG
jgi:tRNA (cytidine/uridine-2'-O-)-methyltransferase